MTELVLRAVPALTTSRRRPKPVASFDSEEAHRLRYRKKRHAELPHIVKFSGGRSSGMMLFLLLENGILDPARGDVIVFNNTASEHPDTYRFVRDCEAASCRYGVPFFWIEFQTYEDVVRRQWSRRASYRLVNNQPWSLENPDGFHWRGEVFEELLSWSCYVPNQFRRICTQKMKLETTRMFLMDWLAGKDGIARQGHYGKTSRIKADAMYARHQRSNGSVPKHILTRKRDFVLNRPHYRPDQRFDDFSPVWQPFENQATKDSVFGGRARFAKRGGHMEYVAFVGLRGDEQNRVKRVEDRNGGPGASGYEGEHVYMPLADLAISRSDVNAFWDQQEWDLALPSEGSLSNCVYCFLKGAANLEYVHQRMEAEKHREIPGFGSLADTPCDVDWWDKMERQYGRDLEAEKRQIHGNPRNKLIGFFGTSTGFSYSVLREKAADGLAEYSESLLPCDCTE
ncbi:MAG: hypothetical protein F4060_02400 [Holophagales bacterium]|nr:hypothetical protein [Holophagales bacterium]MYG30080.1 hypothetical protein [Holophagales bacterium]MYI78768.1 hypothetical protein [Holophagales bacterium]